jgi:hypothetical protein
MTHTFEQLAALVAEKKEVWVDLFNDVKICLIDVADKNNQIFLAKFMPCARNSRTYNIDFTKVKGLDARTSGGAQ